MTFDNRFQRSTTEIFRGRSNLFYIPRQYLPATEMVNPSWGLQLPSGSTTRSEYQATNCTGGADPSTAATLTIKIASDSSTFEAGTTAVVVLKNILILGGYEDVSVEYDVQSGATATTIASGIVTNLRAAIDDTLSITNGRIRCTNTSATRADIETGLKLKYHNTAASAFASTAETITITTLASLGANSNFVEVATEVLAKPPDIFTTDSDGFPLLAGCENWGYTQNLQLSMSASKQQIVCDQQLPPIDDYINQQEASVSFEVLQDRNSRFLQLIAGDLGRASNNTHEILLPSTLSRLRTFALLFTTPSPEYDGQYDKALFYRVAGGSLQITRALRQNAPIQAQFSLQALNRTDFCYIAKYTPSLT